MPAASSYHPIPTYVTQRQDNAFHRKSCVLQNLPSACVCLVRCEIDTASTDCVARTHTNPSPPTGTANAAHTYLRTAQAAATSVAAAYQATCCNKPCPSRPTTAYDIHRFSIRVGHQSRAKRTICTSSSSASRRKVAAAVAAADIRLPLGVRDKDKTRPAQHYRHWCGCRPRPLARCRSLQ